jgi:calcium permeable stress-gated cation channel
MLHDIPKNLASDEGISKIIDSVAPSSSFARTAVARNVKILPELIQEHEKTVRKLEKVLAKYLKDPQNLPPARPMIKPSRHDRSYDTYPKGQKVDAIEYLTQRIKELEIEIKEVRLSVDKRSSMPYGFASYDDISETHAIAFACKKKKPLGAIVNLAPRPHDIIWDNMPLSSGSRSRRRMFNNLWIALLTLIWIAPNAMIAIFLVNLSNLGLVWPAFQLSLEAHTAWWSVVQGVASPALTSLIYLLLPILFRRMSIRAGDLTKTGRERHVLAKLYTFFVFNNLFAFSVFSGIWTFVATVVDTANKTQNGVTTNVWEAIVKANFGDTVFQTLCHISPFFVTWLLQRQLGAAVDLAQLWTLFYSFIMRKFSNPTPRELIELTAPQPFDYASYYNYFLFYATVTLCYTYVQPLVLPAAALYFCIDVPLKKYLIMYVFVTKTESGGMFWRVLFNRFLFGTILSNLVVFLVVWVRGIDGHLQAYCVAPLPFLLIGFKFYCAKAFDNRYYYYSTRPVAGRHVEGNLPIKEQANLRGDRLAMRFGNPALYKPLITPMVHAKAQNILASVYQGRLSDGREAGSGDTFSTSGYSDTYALDSMAAGKVGKSKSSRGAVPGFELVPENRLDFEYYKNRNEFAEDHGAGELFGRPEDQIRPGTPGSSTVMGEGSRPGTPQGGMGFGRGRRAPGESSLGSGGVGTTYAAGYASPPQQYQSQYPGQQTYTASPPLMPVDAGSRSGSLGPAANRSNFYAQGGNDSGSNLVRNAQAMPVSPPPVSSPTEHPGSRGQSRDRYGTPRAPGMLGGGPYGYGGLPQADEDEPGSYDYFRGSANTRTPGAGAGGAQRRDTSDTYRSASGGGGYRGVGGAGQGYRG